MTTEEAAQEGGQKTKGNRKEERKSSHMLEILGDSQPSVEGSPWLLAQLALLLPSAPPCTFEAGNLLTNHVDPFGFSTSASCTGEGPGASRASNATGIVP